MSSLSASGLISMVDEPPQLLSMAENAEYDSLVEMHEAQQLPANGSRSPQNDVEAARPAVQDTENVPKPAALNAKDYTFEQLRAMRIKPIDNIRAIFIFLLILQNAAIQAVSSHPQVATLQETSPKMLAFVNVFVGMSRLLVVPFLFFLSGFSSHFAMAVHDGGAPLNFIARKAMRSFCYLVLYRSTVRFWRCIHPLALPVGVDKTTVPYYASQEGIDAMLNGPTAYALSIFAFDFIYFCVHVIIRLTSSSDEPQRPNHFINSAQRYNIMKYVLGIGVELWVIFFSTFIAYRPRSLSRIQGWLYAANGAELHFPLLYIGAYIAGIQFISYYKFLLGIAPNSVRVTGRKAGITLVVRVLISFIFLYLTYTNYPQTMPPFLDVRNKPSLTLIPAGTKRAPEEGAQFLYTVWVGYTLLVVPDAVIAAFFSIPSLAKDWGQFSRYACIQVYVAMILVIGSSVQFLGNLFVRWMFLGGLVMLSAHCLGVVGVITISAVQRGWKALRAWLHPSAESTSSGGIVL